MKNREDIYGFSDVFDAEDDDAVEISTRKKPKSQVKRAPGARRADGEIPSGIAEGSAGSDESAAAPAKPQAARPAVRPQTVSTMQTARPVANPQAASATQTARPVANPQTATATQTVRPAANPQAASATQTVRPVANQQATSVPQTARPAVNPQATSTAQTARPAANPQAASAPRTARPTANPQTASAPQTARPVANPQATSAPQTARPAANPQAASAPQTARPAANPQATAATPAARPVTRAVADTVSAGVPSVMGQGAFLNNSASRPRKKKITVGCIVRRSLLVVFTALIFTVGVLAAVCNTLANGPSTTARDLAVMSAFQASATKWLPGLFLSDETVEQIKADSTVVNTDVKPITDIQSGGEEGDADGDKWENAIDGMIYENVNGATFKGYVLLVKDPSRVTVAISSNDFANATAGKRIFEIAEEYNALAAINGGEFRDDGGVGTGYAPMGLTYADGECVWNDGLSRTFMGFDKNDRLFVGEGTTYAQAQELGMRDAVSFQTGNVLITNDGENVTYYYADSNTGVAQRTAIGQCADGTVIFLVTDGRTASSMGATRNDIIDTLASYGAVTAGMLDGGSSSMLYYRDYYTKYNIDQNLLDEYQLMGLVNKYKAFTNPRRIPTFFIVK